MGWTGRAPALTAFEEARGAHRHVAKDNAVVVSIIGIGKKDELANRTGPASV